MSSWYPPLVLAYLLAYLNEGMNEFSIGKSTGFRYKYKNNKAFCLGLTFLKADLDENIRFGKNKKTEFLQ